MSTCLITPLKSDTIYPNLPKLGAWSVIREQEAGQDWDYTNDFFYVHGKANTPFTIESDDVTSIYFAGNLQTLPYNGAIGGGGATYRTIAFSQKGTIRISSKYNVNLYGISNKEGVLSYNVNKNQQLIDFCLKTTPSDVNIIRSNYTGIYGDLEDLNGFSNLTNLQLKRTQVKGNISILKNLQNLEEIDLSTTNVSGDFGSLGDLTHLTSMYFGATGISGDIETFVHKNVTHGRTVAFTSPIRINGVLSSGVTFGGLEISEPSAFLSWESDSRIVIYTGGAYSSDAYTHVYAKGATAEEIAAWENAGKTVVIVE